MFNAPVNDVCLSKTYCGLKLLAAEFCTKVYPIKATNMVFLTKNYITMFIVIKLQVKECLSFCGQLDPARGNVLYAQVHEVSKECLDTIHADNIALKETDGVPTMHNTGLTGSVGGCGVYG